MVRQFGNDGSCTNSLLILGLSKYGRIVARYFVLVAQPSVSKTLPDDVLCFPMLYQ